MRFAFSLLLPLVILIIIITVIIVVISIKKEGNVGEIDNNDTNSQGGEEMIKTLYVYLVLFATLMMSIGGSVSAFMAVADLVAPTPYYQSYEDYRRWEINGKDDYREPGENFVAPDEAEIKANYDSMIIRERQREISRAKNTLIKSFGWILIPFGIFVFYQRQLVEGKE